MKRPGGHAFKLLLFASSLASLGACARSDRDRPEIGAGLSSHWLVGGWVLKGDACESDAGVIHRPDGSWHADGASGTWRLEGDELTYAVTDEEDESGRVRRIDPPVRHVEQVELVASDEYVSRRSDGSVRSLTRCP